MQTIIGLAKKNDYLIEGNGKGEFNPDFSKINKITSMKEIIDRERLINELQNAFCDFLKENDSENEYSLEKVAELIDSFVEFQGALFYYDMIRTNIFLLMKITYLLNLFLAILNIII